MSVHSPWYVSKEIYDKLYQISLEERFSFNDQVINHLLTDPYHALNVLLVEAKNQGVSLEALCSGLIRKSITRAMEDIWNPNSL